MIVGFGHSSIVRGVVPQDVAFFVGRCFICDAGGLFIVCKGVVVAAVSEGFLVGGCCGIKDFLGARD